jgi:hypothetical protein
LEGCFLDFEVVFKFQESAIVFPEGLIHEHGNLAFLMEGKDILVGVEVEGRGDVGGVE